MVTVPSMPAASWWTGVKWTASPVCAKSLVRRSDQFVRVVTEKMMTYALGRGVEYQDMPLVRSIVRDSADGQYKFSSIVLGIVKSPPFQMNMKTAGDTATEQAAR